jgi:thermolabile hemolysin
MRYILLLCLYSCVSACSWRLHEPSAGINPSWDDSPWVLRCETARSYPSVPGEFPAVDDIDWLWAADKNNHQLTLTGELEDGFFLLGSAFASTDEPILATKDTLRALCLDTMSAAYPQQSRVLGKVRAARPGEDVDVAIVYPPQSIDSHELKRVVVFGDSLSDAGRLKDRLYIFPGKPYWMGRFSNGPIWTSYLEASSELAVQNHSYGGASVVRTGTLPGEGLIARLREGGQFFVSGSIELQIEDYIDRNLTTGHLQDPDGTLFVVWAGANDYISKEPISGAIYTFLNSPEGESGYQVVADKTIAGLVDQIHRLYKIGARRFLLPDLPDLGLTPIVLQNKTYISGQGFTSDEGRRHELSRRLSELTDYHNRVLRAAIAQLRQDLSDSTVLLLNSSQFTQRIRSGRSLAQESVSFDYGFTLQAQRETLDHKGHILQLERRCYSGGYIGAINTGTTCDSPRSALFWDVVHPTSFTHCWQAYQLGLMLAEQGWIKRPPQPDAYRDWCTGYPSRDA